jgi:NAD(P)-dependent dehydrogenase (short-subunit alcohol dehydrogenase family)
MRQSIGSQVTTFTIANRGIVDHRIEPAECIDARSDFLCPGRWNGSTAYAESKLHDAMLGFAVARRWPDVCSNSLEPGWVPTKMGGAGAPDDMDQAHLTQAWLAASDEPEAKTSGRYFYHLRPLAPNPQADNASLQERLIAICAELSGVAFPH